jgi:hypothetical protein
MDPTGVAVGETTGGVTGFTVCAVVWLVKLKSVRAADRAPHNSVPGNENVL